MKKGGRLSFRKKLFAYLAVFMAFLIFAATLIFLLYNTSRMTGSAHDLAQQNASLVTQKIDFTIEQMRYSSLIILYNDELQDLLYQSEINNDDRVNYFDQHPEIRRQVQNILVSSLGSQLVPRRVTLYNNQRNFVSFSTSPNVSQQNFSNEMAYVLTAGLAQPENYSVLSPPHKDIWMAEENAPYVISFTRRILYSRNGSTNIGHLEIQQPYSLISDICDEAAGQTAQVLVRDAEGNQIYPLAGTSTVDYSLYYNTAAQAETEAFSVHNTQTNEDDWVYTQYSQQSGWTVYYIIPSQMLFSSVHSFQATLILSGLLLLSICLLVLYLGTHRLTQPLRKMRQEMEQLTLEMPSLQVDIQKNENNELVLFQTTFNKTIERLSSSFEQLSQARVLEYEARYLALQSQMNPHFIHNSLMAVSAVAMEDKSETVVEMCRRLSGMLRYVTNPKVNATLAEEVKYATDYAEMMKYRHEANLDYRFEVTGDPDAYTTPRPILQPLLENAFNHSFTHAAAPYQLHVRVYAGHGGWYAEVENNGLPFSPKAKEKLAAGIDAHKNQTDPGHKTTTGIGGMGLINIFARLDHVYKDGTVFEVTTSGAGNTVVRIGGAQPTQGDKGHVPGDNC